MDNKKIPRSHSKRSSSEEKLTDLLAIFANHPNGIPLSLPESLKEQESALTYSKRGKIPAPEQKLYQQLDLYSFIEPIAERTYVVLTKGGKEEREISEFCYRLNHKGQHKLSPSESIEHTEYAVTEDITTSSQQHLTYSQQILPANHDIQTSLHFPTTQPIQSEKSTIDDLPPEFSALYQELMHTIGNTIHKFIAQICEKNRQNRQAVTTINTDLRSANLQNTHRENLLQRVLAHIPSDQWAEIAEVYQKIRRDGVEIEPGALNDLLNELARRDLVKFRSWTDPLHRIPHPEHAIMRHDVTIIYYVQRKV
jgi:hypothetical protein